MASPARTAPSATRPRDEATGAGAATVHRPTCPGNVQDWSRPVHALLQHTPPTQNVEAQSVFAEHNSPRPSSFCVAVTVGVAVAVDVGVGVGVSVGVCVGVAVGVGVSVGVTVGVFVGVGVSVGVCVAVGVGVGVLVGVSVGVGVLVGVEVGATQLPATKP